MFSVQCFLSNPDRKVGGTDKGGGSDNLHAGVGYVGFGVEFLFGVDAARDFAGSEAVYDRRHAVQKIVPLLFRFDAAVQTTLCVFHRLREGNS